MLRTVNSSECVGDDVQVVPALAGSAAELGHTGDGPAPMRVTNKIMGPFLGFGGRLSPQGLAVEESEEVDSPSCLLSYRIR